MYTTFSSQARLIFSYDLVHFFRKKTIPPGTITNLVLWGFIPALSTDDISHKRRQIKVKFDTPRSTKVRKEVSNKRRVYP